MKRFLITLVLFGLSGIVSTGPVTIDNQTNDIIVVIAIIRPKSAPAQVRDFSLSPKGRMQIGDTAQYVMEYRFFAAPKGFVEKVAVIIPEVTIPSVTIILTHENDKYEATVKKG